MEEQWFVDRTRLRHLRQTQPHWSQAQLAHEIGRSTAWVKKWVKRLQADPSEQGPPPVPRARGRAGGGTNLGSPGSPAGRAATHAGAESHFVLPASSGGRAPASRTPPHQHPHGVADSAPPSTHLCVTPADADPTGTSCAGRSVGVGFQGRAERARHARETTTCRRNPKRGRSWGLQCGGQRAQCALHR